VTSDSKQNEKDAKNRSFVRAKLYRGEWAFLLAYDSVRCSKEF
jgi:hypothetical protein